MLPDDDNFSLAETKGTLHSDCVETPPAATSCARQRWGGVYDGRDPPSCFLTIPALGRRAHFVGFPSVCIACNCIR